jgi:glucokinase
MKMIGIDIGGTKCRLSLGSWEHSTEGSPLDTFKIEKSAEPHITAEYGPREILERLLEDLRDLSGGEPIAAIGISCGGPLDEQRGVILSPPNLPGWDNIQVTDFFREHTGVPAYLCNDANAGALAEWKYGGGKGCRNVIFITFGTGLGAGLILDGRLYSGTNGQAGEIGHIRIAGYGPPGYGKLGSLEGFCSGGGIEKLARSMVEAELQQGKRPEICPSFDDLEALTAKTVGIAAEQGDPLALAIYEEVGRKLGAGLAILIDILNPEVIIIGSIFTKSRKELWPASSTVIEEEALAISRKVCRIRPSMLGDTIGVYAALAVAQYGIERF